MPAVTPAAKLRKAIRRKLNDTLYPERRRVPVNCSLSKVEDEKLRRRAKRLGMPKATCLRELAFAYSETRYLVPTNIERKLEAVVFLMRNIASNINQLAARANRNKQTNYSDYLKLKEIVLSIEDRIKQATHNPKLADDRQVNE